MTTAHWVLHKVDRMTGALVWKNPISRYTGIPGDFARATPAIAGDVLILGNQSGKFVETFFQAAVSVANDVVFGCNLNFGKGTMRALHAKTGEVLWSFDSGISCNAGPSIVDGMVYWGSGTFQGLPGVKKMFAFGL